MENKKTLEEIKKLIKDHYLKTDQMIVSIRVDWNKNIIGKDEVDLEKISISLEQSSGH